jgi:hypothetical protein
VPTKIIKAAELTEFTWYCEVDATMRGNGQRKIIVSNPVSRTLLPVNVEVVVNAYPYC